MEKFGQILSTSYAFLKAKISLIIIGVLVAVILSIVSKEADKQVFTDVNVTVEKPTLKEMKPEVKKEFCESDKQYVIESNALLSMGNFIVLDLNTFELIKTRKIDNDRVGYWYKRHGKNDEFYTVWKHKPSAE